MLDSGLILEKLRVSLANCTGRTYTVGSQPLDHHPGAQICHGCDLIKGVQNGSDGQGCLRATAAAELTERGGARPQSRRSSPTRRFGGQSDPGLGRGACPRYAQGTGGEGGLLGGSDGLVAERGGASSPGERRCAGWDAPRLRYLAQKDQEAEEALTELGIGRGGGAGQKSGRTDGGARRGGRGGIRRRAPWVF